MFTEVALRGLLKMQWVTVSPGRLDTVSSIFVPMYGQRPSLVYLRSAPFLTDARWLRQGCASYLFVLYACAYVIVVELVLYATLMMWMSLLSPVL